MHAYFCDDSTLCLQESVVRLEVYQYYDNFWGDADFQDVLVIRRGVDSPLMEESFFGTIEEACVDDDDE